MNEKQLINFVRRFLFKEKDSIIRTLDSVESDLQAIEFSSNTDKISFRVCIHSFWQYDGEEDVVVELKCSLKEAMERAIEQFQTVNRRKDIQGEYFVYAIMPSGLAIRLPEECFREFKNY